MNDSHFNMKKNKKSSIKVYSLDARLIDYIFSRVIKKKKKYFIEIRRSKLILFLILCQIIVSYEFCALIVNDFPY